MEIQVRKKGGQLAPFDRNKVSNGMLKSGATAEEAAKIAAEVESWARGAAKDGVVNTLDVRAKVLELLRGVNPTAAASFEAYKKPE